MRRLWDKHGLTAYCHYEEWDEKVRRENSVSGEIWHTVTLI